MTITDQELRIYRIAEAIGVEIKTAIQGDLRPGDLGGWFPQTRTIFINPRLGPRNRLHTMAHELGHAVHDHPAGHTPKCEREANNFAANLLIDAHAYREAEMIYEGHEGAIAQELGVTLSLLRHWKTLYERQTI